ncbi:hypothetical protein P8452_64219 [Trifolium repens]|nr:hypothetical protein P8452_64219 [Trifolium repens]
MFAFLTFTFLLFLTVKKIMHSNLELFRVQRSKRKIVTRMEDLPQESVCNILSRLPARELLKCKCVSKSWFNLIIDPHFISNYYVTYNNLIYSQNQEEHLLVIRRPFISGVKTYISLLSWSLNDPKKNMFLRLF